jgi:hypothetical protein
VVVEEGAGTLGDGERRLAAAGVAAVTVLLCVGVGRKGCGKV